MAHNVWVGRCLIHTQPEADEPHEHPWNAQCYAAVWTETYDGFAQAVRDHCQTQGHYLVWAEQVYPILDWLHRHGHHNTLIDLAKTVDGNHGIALSPLMPRGEAGQSPPQPAYLEITEHVIPPLPDQSDQPRWAQDWIVPELKDLLFGQSDPKAPLRTYLIVDATLRTRISGIFDLDLQDVPVRCLVRPQRAEDLREVAPYLVDMTLPEGAWDDRRQVPNFHIDFFAHHWQQGTGILVRTTADMDAVWAHFHPFVRVQVEHTQEWLFFRFWDPETFYPMGKYLQTSEKYAHVFFLTTTTKIFLYHPNKSKLITYIPTEPFLNQSKFRIEHKLEAILISHIRYKHIIQLMKDVDNTLREKEPELLKKIEIMPRSKRFGIARNLYKLQISDIMQASAIMSIIYRTGINILQEKAFDYVTKNPFLSPDAKTRQLVLSFTMITRLQGDT